MIGACEVTIHITKGEDMVVDNVRWQRLVDAWCIRLHCCLHTDDWRQRIPIDAYQIQGILGDVTALRSYHNNGLTHITHFLQRYRMLYHRLCTEGGNRINDVRGLTPRQDSIDARQFLRCAGIDTDNACMWIGTPQHSSMEHPWYVDVVGEGRLTH